MSNIKERPSMLLADSSSTANGIGMGTNIGYKNSQSMGRKGGGVNS
jgi:hypothetical protein